MLFAYVACAHTHTHIYAHKIYRFDNAAKVLNACVFASVENNSIFKIQFNGIIWEQTFIGFWHFCPFKEDSRVCVCVPIVIVNYLARACYLLVCAMNTYMPLISSYLTVRQLSDAFVGIRRTWRHQYEWITRNCQWMFCISELQLPNIVDYFPWKTYSF